MKRKNRLLSILLSLAVCLGTFPAVAYAEDSNPEDTPDAATELVYDLSLIHIFPCPDCR